MKTSSSSKRKLMLSGGITLAAAISLYTGHRLLNEKDLLAKDRTEPVVEIPALPSMRPANEAQTNNRKIKIGLLLDTSNSMDGLIDQAKSQLWTIVNELAAAKCDSIKPEIEIALYEYGNDNLSAEKGFVRLVTPLTNDLDKISEELFRLTTNGGDEYCGHVIQTATKQLDWSSNETDLQVLFIAGNEPFSQGRINYKDACQEARKKNIIVNTIFCGDFNEGLHSGWKNGADLAGGSYMSIEQNSKTVFIPSPYDDEITQLNQRLNATYIEYGRQGKIRKESQMVQDSNAKSYGSANEVKRTVSKTTHIYKNKSWDLVDASEDKSFSFSSVPSEELPDIMKSMTQEQKINYVAQKRAEREKIKAEIVELNKKRESYVAQQQKNSGSETNRLDKSMLQAIRKQAAGKNFTF